MLNSRLWLKLTYRLRIARASKRLRRLPPASEQLENRYLLSSTFVNMDANLYGVNEEQSAPVESLDVFFEEGIYQGTFLNPSISPDAQFTAWSNRFGVADSYRVTVLAFLEDGTRIPFGGGFGEDSAQEAFDLLVAQDRQTFELVVPSDQTLRFTTTDRMRQLYDNVGGVSISFEPIESDDDPDVSSNIILESFEYNVDRDGTIANASHRGVDFGYKIEGEDLSQPAEIAFYWADGDGKILNENSPLHTETLKYTKVGTYNLQKHRAGELEGSTFDDFNDPARWGKPVDGAERIVAVINPDKKIAESYEDDNRSDGKALTATKRIRTLCRSRRKVTSSTTRCLSRLQIPKSQN